MRERKKKTVNERWPQQKPIAGIRASCACALCLTARACAGVNVAFTCCEQCFIFFWRQNVLFFKILLQRHIEFTLRSSTRVRDITRRSLYDSCNEPIGFNGRVMYGPPYVQKLFIATPTISLFVVLSRQTSNEININIQFCFGTVSKF